MTDIDIDFADPAAALHGLRYVAAAIAVAGQARAKHPSGVYFQPIPVDPLDGMAAWDYREAAVHGYFKLDFLANSLYAGVRDEAHLLALLAREPPWPRLNEPAVVERLHHLNNHFDVVQMMEPTSIEELAVCIALIRPGKMHLIGRPRYEVMRDIWQPTVKYHYKRAHAIAFAAAIVVQFNLLIESGI